jgi:hypothetical protein
LPPCGVRRLTLAQPSASVHRCTLAAYLLVIGVKTATPDERIPAPAVISSGDKSRSK